MVSSTAMHIIYLTTSCLVRMLVTLSISLWRTKMPGKPQYKTLVRALNELIDAVRLAYGPITPESGSLGDRMDRLQAALNQAEDIAERARVAVAQVPTNRGIKRVDKPALPCNEMGWWLSWHRHRRRLRDALR